MATASATSTTADDRREWRTRAASAPRRDWFALLFDAGPVTITGFAELAGIHPERAALWIGEQVGSGVLRVVGFDERLESEVILPGEHVTALLGDDLSPALDGAREMARAHAERIAPIVRELADTA